MVVIGQAGQIWHEGGLNINSVPDRALIGIDIRTIPTQAHAQIRELGIPE